ncbi:MAG TPA: YfhO family protein, partial [Nitrospirota bacterium]
AVFGSLLAASMLVLLVYRKGWLPRRYLAAVAVIFILADLWPVGWEFIKTVPVSSTEGVYFVETPAIKTVKADKDGRFRVFSMVTNNELLYYGIESMTGYHAVVLGYYEQMLGRVDFAGPALDLMNARYMMLPKDPEYDLARMPELAKGGALAGKYELIDDKDIYLYKNRSAMSAARLVNTIWVANDPDQALDVVSDRRFQPGSAAVVSEKPEFTIAAGSDLSGQKVEETLFSPDRIAYKVYSPAPSFMVFSEVWYPGWKAYVDGAETKIYRTDYLLRGIAMPEGEHEVEMVFDPPLYKIGAGVSLFTLCALAFLIVRGYRETARDKSGAKGKQGQAR